MLVNGALGQAVDPPGRVGLTADISQMQVFLPDALTFAGAMNHPLRAGVSFPCSSHRLDRRSCSGFHLMMKAISRDTALACAVISCISFKEQKPESARTSKGPVTRLAAIGKAR